MKLCGIFQRYLLSHPSPPLGVEERVPEGRERRPSLTSSMAKEKVRMVP
jgi:hypothetical protein